MRTRHISSKGTWEYSAPRLVREGGLDEGQGLVLPRETGKIARFDDMLTKYLGPESCTRAVATDKYIVTRLRDEFKE